MGGATNRLFTLLSTTTLAAAPIVLRRRSISSFSSLLFRRRFRPLSSPSPRRRLHSRAALNDSRFQPPLPSNPWPEWSRLLDNLSAAGYFDRRLDSRAGEVLFPTASPDFSRAAAVCLEFARERPGLVRLLSGRDVEMVVGNGTALYYGNSYEANVLDMGNVSTVELMNFILRFVSNLRYPSESGHIHNRELIESSVRKLLLEMAKLCYAVTDTSSFGSAHDKFADGNGDPRRHVGSKIEMKRGDWICTRCSFMNFAKNMKCLKCEEARPKAQLTGGEWECPQCAFYNYGRNKLCLKCDCKRPGEVPVSATGLGTGYENGSNLNGAEIDSRFANNEAISQMDSTSNPGSSVAGDDLPLRKDVNRFVASTRKTPLERRLANTQYQIDSGNFGSPADSPPNTQSGGKNSTYVPFVPLPADMFAKKPESSEEENTSKDSAGSVEVDSSSARQRATNEVGSDKSEAISSKPSSQAEFNTGNKEQAEKSDKWFEKVTELHRSVDRANAGSSDGDFPEIMPMRKGENRFVLSKKKDRSLTSPAYKRQMAMEQASDAKFVPFVPFPPDYFSKKNDSTPNPVTEEKLPQRPEDPSNDRATQIDNRSSFQSRNPEPSADRFSVRSGEIPNKTPDSTGSSGQQTRDGQRVREGWARKSLEGSAVKETDPLDMSEEAKAERWFRRVAQIKDISELSQIPDEDFPSIMPMRKGVNRFVVSKRKSPLERRLASPQYRRNLPTVSSDPLNKDSEESTKE